ncbi:17S U2 SnRNP complex component HTATSF1 [Eurosta solidaginis]|uniref:17S U2 SnRNP complex component HTATSF1 n=1 Tax=Eurosta solidaginis TaxID=178769 RepID=UPI003530F1D4
MSENIENLSENLTKAIDNEESKPSEGVSLASFELPSPSSKETVSTTFAKNIDAEKEEETFETETLANVVEITAEKSVEADSSTELSADNSSKSKNISKSSEKGFAETENSTELQVNTNTSEKESLKTPRLITDGEGGRIKSSDLGSSTQVPESGEDGFAGAANPIQNSTYTNSTQREEETLRVSKSNAESDDEKSDGKRAQESITDPKTPDVADKDDNTIVSSPAVSTDEGVDVNYAEHVTYESDGSAIYVDPNTKYRYKWSSTENNWIADSSNTEGTAFSANPYENDHYKWCNETQKWIPKIQTQTTETEHYKWDAERREWIPKVKTANTDTKSSFDPSNVTYDMDENGQRIYTDTDGTVFFWDTTKNAWFPKIDDDFMAHYQMNYGFIDNTSAAEEEKRRKAEEEEKLKELKELELQRMTEEAKAGAEAMAQGNIDGVTGSGAKRKAQEPPKWFEINPDHNTKVYVSNLPLDITLDEFAELMSKCGMIMRDQQTQKYKLKLYSELDGQLKGDGLCDYIKVESVGLALNILDEYNLRGNKIRVQRAEFQMRGEYNPALKPKRKKKDKEKLQKIKEKLFDWRPEKMRGERSKNEKVVIIKNLFDPSIFEKEVQLILDYQNDLREECSKCGTVRKVVIYDRHPEGVAQINMADPEEADMVIQMMQGRYFGQRQLTAEHWDGRTKYKVVESEAETKKRLSNWDQFLTQEENEKKIEESKSLDTAKEDKLCAEAPAVTKNVLNVTDVESNVEIPKPNEIKIAENEEKTECASGALEATEDDILSAGNKKMKEGQEDTRQKVSEK